MAHFAELDDQNVVIRVVVISNDDITDEDGIEQEQLGVALCNQHVGTGEWVQTSYNGNFRRQFAQPGFKYDPDLDCFYSPTGPFPSWTIDANREWQPPVPKPEPVEHTWDVWNEDELAWDKYVYDEATNSMVKDTNG